MKVELLSLAKRFDDGRVVLDGIDYTGDITTLAIVGPSGGGKSTLLRILGGLIPLSAGAVCIGGEALPATEAELHAYRKKIGFVFQQGGLFKHMTGLQNITLPLIKVHGFSEAQATDRAMSLLKRFGLLEDAGKKPGALSGGQQQRIAIARAIAPKPELLLLDEPTSALDPEYTTQVLNMIDELKKEGINFIIVTHEMGFACHACEKAMFLSEGRILESGLSADIFANPKTLQFKHFLSKLLSWNV